MRLLVELSCNGNDIHLPVHYNHQIQAAIYGALDPELAGFLHTKGFEVGGRSFKLFTFSRLLGEYKLAGQDITFKSPVKLVVCSPVDQFCQSLLNGLISKDSIQLGPVRLKVESVKVEKPMVEEDVLKLRLLSPVVAYSTLMKPEGSKYTCYFQPGEKEFTRVAGENLRKKYRALFNAEPPDGEFEVKCLKEPRLHILQYKGLSIKGYLGPLQLKGPRELLQMALDAGLGSKGSLGFGCGEMVNKLVKVENCSLT